MRKYIVKQKAISALITEADTHSNPVKKAYTRAVAIIEQIAADDVQPVKRGAWRKDEQDYDAYVKCSECGLNLSISNYIENEWREILKYCPCCGARMDGGNEDENG